MKRWLLLFLVLALRAGAHEVRPAYLELTERAPGEFDVLWKVPALGGTPLAGEELPHPQPAPVEDSGATKFMACGCPAPTAAQLSRGVAPIHPSLPKDCEIVVPPSVERIFGAEIRRWTIRVPHGLDGWEVTVHGLQATMVDVLVRVALADGRVVSRVLRPDAPSFTFTAAAAGPAAGGYLRLGVEHILFGIDHLLFVLALVLIVRGVGLLVKTITAFTVAHSITLGLATLGYVHVPSAPVEATIALSIVFVASEILRSRRGERGLTERAPWLVAGTFGLLHGFGFAGAL
ncbi:MAG TPA: HupE/UreJ family protein, partial [Chthoniobacteraceae bacterium]|nr:HupE/UreJ family protein [Chthoniobacteraceae bacterium]